MSQEPDGTKPSAIDQLLKRAVEVRDDEIRLLLLSCAYFFFVLSAYYILRPLRDEMGVAGGVRNLQWLFTGTLVVMLAAHPPFAALVAKLPRTRFVSLTYRFFMVNLLIFFALLQMASESYNIWIGRAFFIWVSVFNLFVISVFWSFMADRWSNPQGKRLFGFIALGGTFGAIVGAAITVFLVEIIGPVNLLLISIVLLEIGVQCVRRLAQADERPHAPTPEPIGNLYRNEKDKSNKTRFYVLRALFRLNFAIASASASVLSAGNASTRANIASSMVPTASMRPNFRASSAT